MGSATDQDSYIAGAPEAFRPVLGHRRALLREALPDAEEVTSYDMPGTRIGGTVVASYAPFSKQAGLYVLAPAIAAHADELAAAELEASKTGVTSSPRRPIPDDLVRQLATTSKEHADA